MVGGPAAEDLAGWWEIWHRSGDGGISVVGLPAAL